MKWSKAVIISLCIIVVLLVTYSTVVTIAFVDCLEEYHDVSNKYDALSNEYEPKASNYTPVVPPSTTEEIDYQVTRSAKDFSTGETVIWLFVLGIPFIVIALAFILYVTGGKRRFK